MSASKFQKGFVPITYILGMVILSLAIVGGVFLMKQTKDNTSNTYQLTPVPISATPTSTPLQVTESEPVSLNEGVDQKSFINLTTCKAGEEINQAFGLGSRSLTAKGLKGDLCLMEYFQEIEGGGTISECNLPVSMGEITLPSLDVNKYCKEIRKTSLLNP